jgi:hypothetical protein
MEISLGLNFYSYPKKEGVSMNKRMIAILFVAGLIAYLVSGCVFVSVDFLDTRDMITSELGPVDVDTEVQLRIGSGLLSFSRLVASCADVDREAMLYLRDINNVQVGVYKLHHTKNDRPLRIPEKIGERLARKGYESMVRVKNHDEVVWVLTQTDRRKLKALYIIVLDHEELVLVEVRGRLGRLIEKAIREHGFEKDKYLDL